MKVDDIQNNWEEKLFSLLLDHKIDFLPYVPDAGHAKLIALAEKNRLLKPVVLTSEEEGVAFASGSWLGNKKSVLLMQSSGVGNCINMLSILSKCNFPFVTLITMRGEFGEFNSWQIPMGQATKKTLEAMGIIVHRATYPSDVCPLVDAALYGTFSSDQQIAILLSQRLIGKKKW